MTPITPARVAAHHLHEAERIAGMLPAAGQFSWHNGNRERIRRFHLASALVVIRSCAGGKVRDEARRLLGVVEGKGAGR